MSTEITVGATVRVRPEATMRGRANETGTVLSYYDDIVGVDFGDGAGWTTSDGTFEGVLFRTRELEVIA